MANETEHKFPSVDRRINYLRQELYTYDKYLRNPTKDGDMATSAKWAIDADDYSKELDELTYLRNLAADAQRPSSMTRWQAALITVSSVIAITIAGLSLYIALG